MILMLTTSSASGGANLIYQVIYFGLCCGLCIQFATICEFCCKYQRSRQVFKINLTAMISCEMESISVSAAIELLVKAGFQIIDGEDHSDKRVLGT